MDFTGKVAFITGAGGYLGSSNARYLAARGALVAVADKNEESVNRTAEEIRAQGGQALALPIDITDSSAVDAAVKKTVETFGRLDILIHAAGGSARSRAKKLVDQSDEVIRDVLEINLMGAFWSARAAARQMLAQGDGGKILLYSSAVGFMGLAYNTDYAASKGGVSAMVRALAKEVSPHGVCVNAIAPGVVMRPGAPGGDEYALNTNLFHRQCRDEDISRLAAFLVSEDSDFITGQTYIIDGGRSLSMKGTD